MEAYVALGVLQPGDTAKYREMETIRRGIAVTKPDSPETTEQPSWWCETAERESSQTRRQEADDAERALEAERNHSANLPAGVARSKITQPDRKEEAREAPTEDNRTREVIEIDGTTSDGDDGDVACDQGKDESHHPGMIIGGHDTPDRSSHHSDDEAETLAIADGAPEDHESFSYSGSLPSLLDAYADSPRARDSITEAYMSTPSDGDHGEEEVETWSTGTNDGLEAYTQQGEPVQPGDPYSEEETYIEEDVPDVAAARRDAKARGRNMELSISDSVAASSMSEHEASSQRRTRQKKRRTGSKDKTEDTQEARGRNKERPEEHKEVTKLVIDRTHKTYVSIKFEEAHPDGNPTEARHISSRKRRHQRNLAARRR